MEVLSQYHLAENPMCIGQPGDIFYGHIAPIKKDAITISDGIWEFVEDHDLGENLEIFGGDSCVVNTRGGPLFHGSKKMLKGCH